MRKIKSWGEEGHDEKAHRCVSCGSMFAFESNDVVQHRTGEPYHDGIEPWDNTAYVQCPGCGGEIYVSEYELADMRKEHRCGI